MALAYLEGMELGTGACARGLCRRSALHILLVSQGDTRRWSVLGDCDKVGASCFNLAARQACGSLERQ